MTPEAVRALMFAWLLAHGYQPFQAEAVLHQAHTESRFNHCVTAPSGSFGLFQWVGSRKRKLHERYGPGCPTVEQQLAFADNEIRSDFSCFWTASPGNAYAVLRNHFGRGPTC